MSSQYHHRGRTCRVLRRQDSSMNDANIAQHFWNMPMTLMIDWLVLIHPRNALQLQSNLSRLQGQTAGLTRLCCMQMGYF